VRERLDPGRREHRNRNGEVEDRDPVARRFQALSQRLAREQMRMRPVEEAPLGVAEASEQQADAHRPVRDVRRAEDQPATGAKQGADSLQERPGVAQVLDEVTGHDRVEALGLEGQLHRLDVADVNGLAEPTRLLRRALVELQAHDR
jgi:hypothetical protein